MGSVRTKKTRHSKKRKINYIIHPVKGGSNMEQYLQKCKLLGVIDIPFLEKISRAEEWDSLFYELFELLASISKATEEFFIYNKDHLFFLKRKESMEIEIRESPDLISQEEENEFVIVVNHGKGKQKSILLPKIIEYLEEKEVQFQFVKERNEISEIQNDISEIISITRSTIVHSEKLLIK